MFLGHVREVNKTAIVWDEVWSLFDGLGTGQSSLPEDTVVEVWSDAKKLDSVIKSGHKAILSNGWYLNNGGTWMSYYSQDPMSLVNSPTPAQAKLVLGGEACMWTSAFDATTVEAAIWPNAAATAERLWSPADVTNVTTARNRLSGRYSCSNLCVF